jgi:hypothetical protein
LNNSIGEADMKIRSWMVRGWPTVTWQVPEDISVFPTFEHMATEVRPETGPLGRASGDTVWATTLRDRQLLAVAWEWVEVMPGVVVISDPNGLISNARFVAADGLEADELGAACASNMIAYSTPWQKVVISHLNQERTLANAALATARDGAFAVQQSASMKSRHAGRVRARAQAASTASARLDLGLGGAAYGLAGH